MISIGDGRCVVQGGEELASEWRLSYLALVRNWLSQAEFAELPIEYVGHRHIASIYSSPIRLSVA